MGGWYLTWNSDTQSLRALGDGVLKAHTLSKGSYLQGREGEPAEAGSCDQGN